MERKPLQTLKLKTLKILDFSVPLPEVFSVHDRVSFIVKESKYLILEHIKKRLQNVLSAPI